MQIDDQISDFEKEFLTELNQKMFPSSIDQVRQQNHQECQTILQQRRIYPAIDSTPLSTNNIELPSSSSKLLIHEHVYLLPEEVKFTSFLYHSIFFSFLKTIFLQHALGCLTITDQTNQVR
jgi:hypothetical protein